MSNETFSFADLNMESTPDMQPVPVGEYQLQLLSLEQKEYDKDGKKGKYLNVRFEIVGQPTADDVYYTLFLPRAEDTEKQRNKTIGRIKDMFKALGAPMNLADAQQLVGRTCWAILKLTEDPKYGRKNEIGSFVFARS